MGVVFNIVGIKQFFLQAHCSSKDFVQFLVCKFANRTLACRYCEVIKMFLFLYHSGNAFLESVLREEAMHLYVLVLTDTICAVGCLCFYCRIPPEVVMYNVSCCREVETCTGCLQ